MGTAHHPGDAELFQSIRKGDAQAYATLYKRYRKSLWSYAWQTLKSDSACEDTVQDIFLYLWEKRASIKIQQSVKSWLYAAVRNRVISSVRHGIVVRNNESVVDDDPAWMAPNPPIASEQLERDDLKTVIESALAALPERRREMLVLRWTDGLTLAEIAEVYGISAVAVHKQLAAAEEALRPMLEAYYRG